MYEYELTLTGKNRVTIKRTTHGVVAVELSKPGNLRDGHGYLVVATAFICGQELTDLLTAISPAEGASKGACNPSFTGSLHALSEPASGP